MCVWKKRTRYWGSADPVGVIAYTGEKKRIARAGKIARIPDREVNRMFLKFHDTALAGFGISQSTAP